MRFLQWLACWNLYCIGIIFGWVTDRSLNKKWIAFWYPVCKFFWAESVAVQDQAGGNKPRWPWET